MISQIGKHIRIMRAKFLTLREGNYKFGKEQNLNSIRISKQVMRNMEKEKLQGANSGGSNIL